MCPMRVQWSPVASAKTYKGTRTLIAVTKFLGRYPLQVSSAIILCFGASVWAVTYHFETTIRPLQEQMRLSHIAGEIAQADSLLKRKRYETAMKDYKYVLDAYDTELSEQDKGRLNDALGLSYLALSDTKDQVENLNLAIKAFKSSLIYRAPDVFPELYGITWKHIGKAHEALGARRKTEDDFTLAIDAYQKALSVQPVDTDPEGYAIAKATLGGAYRGFYIYSKDKQHTALAFQHYEEALGVLNRREYPEGVGLVLVEIGRTYIALAEYSRRTGNSQNALKEFKKALKLLKAKKFPSQYARVNKYIGDAYSMLTQTKPRNRRDKAEHAQRVYRWQNKANEAYKLAQNFGFNDGAMVISTKDTLPRSSTMRTDSADDKK